MAADLEALYDWYRARGLSEEEAERQAEEKILASPEVLQHLVLVHTTGYQRWLSRAAGRLRWGMDLLLFALGVVPVVAVTTLVAITQIRTAGAGPLLWVILAIGAAIVGLGLGKMYQLFIRRERSLAKLHYGLFTLLFLGSLGPALGATGFIVRLEDLASELMRSGASQAALLRAAERVAVDATVLSVGLLLGIGAGLMWFVLANRIAVIEASESELLLAE